MYDAGLSREAIFGRTCTTLVLKGLMRSSREYGALTGAEV